jgi:dihydrofolate reductase
MFNHDLKVVLEREVWQIVPIKRRSQLHAQENVVASKCSAARSSVDRPNEQKSQLDGPFLD